MLYEPIVNLSNFCVEAVEALAECRQCSEPAGLERLVDEVAADMAHWSWPVHLKLSRTQLSWPELAPRLIYRLERAGAQPRQLVLEIDGPEGAELARAGFRLARDGLGVGPLTLGDLVEAPLSLVKLEASLVAAIPAELGWMRLCAGLIKLLESLDLPSVAQGVASRSQRDYLVRNGCRFAQGRFFGLPVEGSQVPDLLRQTVAP